MLSQRNWWSELRKKDFKTEALLAALLNRLCIAVEKRLIETSPTSGRTRSA